MPFDEVKFKLIPMLTKLPAVPYQPPRRFWTTPDKLYIICEHMVNSRLLPKVFCWTNIDVILWIDRLGFPQYRLTFYENMINGRTLLLVDATALCAMNISDFKHIQIITKAIRDLYDVEEIYFNRSISLPQNCPETQYKLYHVCTGPKFELMMRTELWRKSQICRNKPAYIDHWKKLTKWLKHIPFFQSERLGMIPRSQLYYVKPAPPSVEVVIEPPLPIPCDCIPPCECGWTERNYRLPWKLSCLEKRGLIEIKNLTDNDIILVDEGKEFIECNCIPPCECLWTPNEKNKPTVLAILRCKEKLLEAPLRC